MHNLHLVMPMCGAGSRFAVRDFHKPKPLITIHGKPFFYWSTESALSCVSPTSITFVILQEHVANNALDQVIRDFYPDARLVVLDEVPPGAVLTCLAGIEHLPENDAVLFNDCDHLFRAPAFGEFCKNGFSKEPAGALLTFESDEPKYSFLELDATGQVIRTAEKIAVSTHAICGAYYFSSVKLFRDAAGVYLKNCQYSEYFMSGVYNVLAAEGKPIARFPVSLHIAFGTPEEYDCALKYDFTTI